LQEFNNFFSEFFVVWKSKRSSLAPENEVARVVFGEKFCFCKKVFHPSVLFIEVSDGPDVGGEKGNSEAVGVFGGLREGFVGKQEGKEEEGVEESFLWKEGWPSGQGGGEEDYEEGEGFLAPCGYD
jgi:hypothetical protein